MRALAAALLLTGTLGAAAAHAKDWSDMDGHERRVAVIAYLEQHRLRCPDPGGSVADQEHKLNYVPWALVASYIKLNCTAEVPARALSARAQVPDRRHKSAALTIHETTARRATEAPVALPPDPAAPLREALVEKARKIPLPESPAKIIAERWPEHPWPMVTAQ